jgi:uncharacterized protein YacL
MKWIRRILFILIAASLSYFLGGKLSFALQRTLAQSLSSISSILFGVLGIWVGIMAPDSLKMIYSSKEHKIKKEKWDELEYLFRPIFLSLGVFSLSTVFVFLGEIFKSIGAFVPYTNYFRIAGAFILLILFYITLYLLFLSLKPGMLMLSKSWSFIKTSERKGKVLKNVKLTGVQVDEDEG